MTEGQNAGQYYYLVSIAEDSLREEIDSRIVERWLDGAILGDAGLTEVRRR